MKNKTKIYIKFSLSIFIIFIARLFFNINNYNQIDFMFGMIYGVNLYYWFDVLEKSEQKKEEKN